MADFNLFLPKLLAFEGGFVDNPADPGGATNAGITLSTWRGCAERMFGVSGTLDTLKALTIGQAGAIYRKLYWDALSCDEIELQPLAEMFCDFYVNAGSPAVSLMQVSLRKTGSEGIEADGYFGPKTMDALDDADQAAVYREYKQLRMEYYRRLVSVRPALARFLDGWLARVASFPDI